MAPYPALTIAAHLILRVNALAECGEHITNLRLQKLLYYAQGIHLALRDAPLFPEPILAWVHGPAVAEVYRHYRPYGAYSLPDPPGEEMIDPATLATIGEMFEVYGQYSAWGLRNLTREEDPWRDTAIGEEIAHGVIRTYFLAHLVARNE